VSLLNEMTEEGIITNYALFGATAQMRYTEPVATLDADVPVVRADYLAVIALSVGRAKDFARILALLESKWVTREGIENLARRHGLFEAWDRFQARFLDV
jgi:hypothetical protein